MNINALVVVADSSRARLFRVVESNSPRAPIALKEMESLVHPVARVKEGDRHSDVATHAVHSLLGDELERQLPKEVHVRSEIGELSELTPTELLKELEHRGALRP